MTNPRLMKVSDDERERAAEALSRALANGRIGYEEFEARMDRVFRVENYIELGELVVDLPVRAPRPSTEPVRYGYEKLPNATATGWPQNLTQLDRFELDAGFWPSRFRVAAMMGLRVALVLVAVGVLDARLIGDVLPSTSLLVGAGVALIAVLAALFAVWHSIATALAIPPRLKARRPGGS